MPSTEFLCAQSAFFERSFVDIQAASTVLAAKRLKESGLGQTQHLPAIVNALAPQGALALIDDPDSLDIVPFKRKSLSVHWELMFTRSLFGTPNMDQQHRLLTEVGAGTLSAYELQRIQLIQNVYVDLQQFAAILLPPESAIFYPDGNFLGNTMENSGK
jgi:hypothetical protein